MNNLRVTSSPHLHSGDSVRGVMADVVIALIPAVLVGVFYFGLPALWLILTSVASCVLFEALWQKMMGKPITIGDFSAVVTGLLLAFNVPSTLPLWMIVVGAFFAMIIVKQLFGGLGHNFVNPALAARAFLMASWAASMTKWVTPSVFGMDARTTATPLAMMKTHAFSKLPSLWDMFIGNIGGCIGETSALLLLLGGLYLMIKKVIHPAIPFSFIGTVAVLTFFLGGGTSPEESATIMLAHILSGGLMLGAFFMATDYTTSPTTKWGAYIMGIGCGVLTVIIRLYGGYPEGVSYSILLMNIASPLIDKVTIPRVFGMPKAGIKR